MLLTATLMACDTLLLLGMDKEANEARELIVSLLSFDLRDDYTSLMWLGGQKALYTLSVELPTETVTRKIGLRTVELLTAD